MAFLKERQYFPYRKVPIFFLALLFHISDKEKSRNVPGSIIIVLQSLKVKIRLTILKFLLVVAPISANVLGSHFVLNASIY